MSTSTSPSPSSSSQNKYKGVRQRKWGKWVSEIRVPGTPERLWLGSYATPEAAAIAHDVAYYCLRGGSSSPQSLNFYPLNLPTGARVGLSPRSVQKVASDAGLAVDARLKLDQAKKQRENIHDASNELSMPNWSNRVDGEQEYWSVSVEDYDFN